MAQLAKLGGNCSRILAPKSNGLARSTRFTDLEVASPEHIQKVISSGQLSSLDGGSCGGKSILRVPFFPYARRNFKPCPHAGHISIDSLSMVFRLKDGRLDLHFCTPPVEVQDGQLRPLEALAFSFMSDEYDISDAKDLQIISERSQIALAHTRVIFTRRNLINACPKYFGRFGTSHETIRNLFIFVAVYVQTVVNFKRHERGNEKRINITSMDALEAAEVVEEAEGMTIPILDLSFFACDMNNKGIGVKVVEYVANPYTYCDTGSVFFTASPFELAATLVDQDSFAPILPQTARICEKESAIYISHGEMDDRPAPILRNLERDIFLTYSRRSGETSEAPRFTFFSHNHSHRHSFMIPDVLRTYTCLGLEEPIILKPVINEFIRRFIRHLRLASRGHVVDTIWPLDPIMIVSRSVSGLDAATRLFVDQFLALAVMFYTSLRLPSSLSRELHLMATRQIPNGDEDRFRFIYINIKDWFTSSVSRMFYPKCFFIDQRCESFYKDVNFTGSNFLLYDPEDLKALTRFPNPKSANVMKVSSTAPENKRRIENRDGRGPERRTVLKKLQETVTRKNVQAVVQKEKEAPAPEKGRKKKTTKLSRNGLVLLKTSRKIADSNIWSDVVDYEDEVIDYLQSQDEKLLSRIASCSIEDQCSFIRQGLHSKH
jgi:hypothetical protein